jgi:hypothetical protein
MKQEKATIATAGSGLRPVIRGTGPAQTGVLSSARGRGADIGSWSATTELRLRLVPEPIINDYVKEMHHVEIQDHFDHMP